MERRHSWEATNSSVSQEIPSILWNPKVYNRIHNIPIVNNITYLLITYSTVLLEKLAGLQLVKKFHAFYGTRKFITAFTSTPGSPQWSLSLRFPHQNPVHASLPHTRYMSRPSHSSRFYHMHNSEWGVQIILKHINHINSVRALTPCFLRYISNLPPIYASVFQVVVFLQIPPH
jgi:hypothetical protein